MEIPFSQDLPSEKWRRLINEYAGILPDPALKLKFTRDVLKYFNKTHAFSNRYPAFGEMAFREMLLEEIEKILPGSRILIKKSIQRGEISRPSFTHQNIYRFRRAIPLIVLSGLITGLGIGAIFFFDLIHSKEGSAPVHLTLPSSAQPVAVESDLPGVGPIRKPIAPSVPEKRHFPTYINRSIWLVEKTEDMEIYSNRLQIITSSSVENIPRSYIAFPKNTDTLPGEESLSSEIRGIVYHASEGDMAPFKQEKNRLLMKYSNQLLQYTCRKKGYHYLIDRFGRIYRIVREEDAAFHAGNSVWADDKSIYLNLNHAFIGICFEGKGFKEISDPGSGDPAIASMDASTITDAQVKSGKELTDWLRLKYAISQQNCVPHGIASIYPKNKLVGYHLDLAYGFPFHRFGLRNKYHEMIPSITEFGFHCDSYFYKVLKGNIWPGIKRSENYLKNRAKHAGLSTRAYRKKLNRRFELYYDWQKRLHDNTTTVQTPKNDPHARDEVNP